MGSKSKLRRDNRGNLVNSIAREPLKGFEPKLEPLYLLQSGNERIMISRSGDRTLRSQSPGGDMPRTHNDLPPGLRQPGLSFDSQTIFENTPLWRLKRLTLSTYRRYIN